MNDRSDEYSDRIRGTDDGNQLTTMDEAATAARTWLAHWREIQPHTQPQSHKETSRGFQSEGDFLSHDAPEQMTTIKIPKRGTRIYPSDSLSATFDLSSEVLEKLGSFSHVQEGDGELHTPSPAKTGTNDHSSCTPVPDTWEEWDENAFQKLQAQHCPAELDDDTLSVDSIEEELDKPFADVVDERHDSRDAVLLVDMARLCSDMSSADFDALECSDACVEEKTLNLEDVSAQYYPVIHSLLYQLERDWPRMVEVLMQQGCARMTNQARWYKDLKRFERKNEEAKASSIVALFYPIGSQEETNSASEFTVIQFISLLLTRTNRDIQWRRAVHGELADLACELHRQNAEDQEYLSEEIGKVVRKTVSLKRKRKTLESELQHRINGSERYALRDTARYERKLKETQTEIESCESYLQALRLQSLNLPRLRDSRLCLNDILQDDCKQVHTASVQESLPAKTLSMIFSRICDRPKTESASVRRNYVLERFKTALLWLWHKEIGSFEKRRNTRHDRPNSTSTALTRDSSVLKSSSYPDYRNSANYSEKSSLLLSEAEEAEFFENLESARSVNALDNSRISEGDENTQIAQTGGLRQLASI